MNEPLTLQIEMTDKAGTPQEAKDLFLSDPNTSFYADIADVIRGETRTGLPRASDGVRSIAAVHAAVASAKSAGQTVAAMLFLRHGAVASYHIGWSNEEGRRLNAHNLLLWRGMAYLKSQGLRALDLGGLNTRDLAGISRFKIGAGGEVVTLAGTFFRP